MRLALVVVFALGLGGCAEILSALAASGLTGWLTNRDGCTVQTERGTGQDGGTVVRETRICTETSILPKGLRDWLSPPPPAPAGGTAPSPRTATERP